MDIFMSNIGLTVERDALKIELARVFHDHQYASLYSGPSPMNFSVVIFRKRKGSTRNGILTVPTRNVGERFLQEFGGHLPRRTISSGGPTIRFSPSNKPMQPGVLEAILHSPYVDPSPTEDRRRLAAELQSRAIALKAVQFGWECRDNVFSVEWEKICTESSHLVFYQERREFRIEFSLPRQKFIICIKAFQVSWCSAGINNTNFPYTPETVIYLILSHPPSFESTRPTRPTPETNPDDPFSALMQALRAQVLDIVEQDNTRQRWTHLVQDEVHSIFAPYTSNYIRLLCADTNAVHHFRELCRHATMHLDDYLYPVERRQLFSPDVQKAYASWMRILRWPVVFQIEAMVRGCLLHMREALGLGTRIQQVIREKGSIYAAEFLKHFGTQLKASWYTEDGDDAALSVNALFDKSKRDYGPVTGRRTRRRGLAVDLDTFQCLHVAVTPTTYRLDGPHPERSNRIIRLYPQNHSSFLRVSFVDETNLHYRFDEEVDGRDFIQRRVGKLLKEGITIAGRHFEFLAYSQSALKEHAVWFVRQFRDHEGNVVNASSIIAGLGNFSNLAHDPQLIYCPARYGARISQAFTATDSSVTVEAEEIGFIDDVKDATGKWNFTDGVGTISAELARDIWKVQSARRRGARKSRTYARALQIRFMGSKGMLSVDYRLSGRQVCIRPSMVKFDAPNSRDIEIARAFYRPSPFYLNRPLIMILEGLGVKYEVFKELQDDAVAHVHQAVDSLERAARFLEMFGLGTSYRLTSTMLNLHKLGVGPLGDDPFWKRMMEFAINHVLRDLKHHARIFVPDAWNLVGVADVHEYLGPNEIFACIIPNDGDKPIYLEGPTLVSRSPTSHPGDVQIAHAIGRPPPGSPYDREKLRNTLVFSVKGDRPLSTCLGGGDLDGDEYVVTMREDLRPPRTYLPANYDPAKKKMLNRPSTMQDVADFVTEYINSDLVGMIAIRWLMIADMSPEGILDRDCLKLSELHSAAVDYPKSGFPVSVRDLPKYNFGQKPDWNAPETMSTTGRNEDYKESDKAIGKLYRAIDLPAVDTARREQRHQRRKLGEGETWQLEDILDEFHHPMEPDDSEMHQALLGRIAGFISLERHEDDLVAGIWDLFRSYTSKLQAICADHTLSYQRNAMLTEEEATVGTIVAKCSQPRRRKDYMSKMRDQTDDLVDSFQHELSGEDGALPEASMERAWVAYRIAYIQGDAFGAWSFAWMAMAEIFDKIKTIEDSEGLF